MPDIIDTLDTIPMKNDSYDELTQGWQKIGKHKGVDGFDNMQKISIGHKTITIGCPYYNVETQAVCFLVQYRAKWEPFKFLTFSKKNKGMRENVNAVLSLSDDCELSFHPNKLKTVLVAQLKDKGVLLALLVEAGQALEVNPSQQTDVVDEKIAEVGVTSQGPA